MKMTLSYFEGRKREWNSDDDAFAWALMLVIGPFFLGAVLLLVFVVTIYRILRYVTPDGISKKINQIEDKILQRGK